MKTCPICGAQAIDDAETCFDCLYSFANLSSEACDPRDLRALGTEPTPQQKPTPQQEPTSAPVPITRETSGKIFLELWKRGHLATRYIAPAGSLYVGSAPFNDVALTTQPIARRQLHLYRENGCLYAEVLDTSTSRLFLNGHALDGRVPVHPHDSITFNDVRLVLE